VILDSAGNLYGTTYAGGPANYGVVYKIATGGVETVLHTFAGTPDGATPASGVTMDASGDLYGTTSLGGAAAQGVIYEINVAGQETVLHSFTGAQDGSYPSSGVVLDTADNLYGTTFDGGSGANGVVYMLSASGQQTILYNFTGGTDGANPTGVIRNSAGDLFGSAESGGKGSGIVYKLSPSGVQTVLHSFGGGSDGELPQGNLISAAAHRQGQSLKSPRTDKKPCSIASQAALEVTTRKAAYLAIQQVTSTGLPRKAASLTAWCIN
jgi:uncharacterized repeat protein (TIGR03803 family)